MIVVNGGTPDPVQKAIRDRKKNWNKKMVTPFIDDLIHLKMLINGKPSKFNKEKNFITNPLPARPADMLNTLAGIFRDIVNEGVAIIDAQAAYSQTRKKKNITNIPENTNQPTMPIAASADSVDIIVEGSNYLTRFLSGFKGSLPIFTKTINKIKRRHRISLLKMVHDLYKLCSVFQAEVIRMDLGNILSSNDEEGLFLAIDTLLKIENQFIGILNSIKVLHTELSVVESKENLVDQDGGADAPDTLENDKSSEIEKPLQNKNTKDKPVVEMDEDAINYAELSIKNANEFIKEWRAVSISILDLSQDIRLKVIDLIIKYEAESKSAKNYQTKAFLATRLNALHAQILSDLNMKNNTNAKSLLEYSLIANKKSSSSIEDLLMKKFASKYMQKIQGKILRTFRTKKMHANRTAAYEFAKEFRTALDQFMDILEKDFDAKSLVDIINSTLMEPLSNMAQSIDAMIESIEENLENTKFKDPVKEENRVKLLKSISKRKISLMTRKMLQGNVSLLSGNISKVVLPSKNKSKSISNEIKVD